MTKFQFYILVVIALIILILSISICLTVAFYCVYGIANYIFHIRNLRKQKLSWKMAIKINKNNILNFLKDIKKDLPKTFSLLMLIIGLLFITVIGIFIHNYDLYQIVTNYIK